jgi:hypothetical protein
MVRRLVRRFCRALAPLARSLRQWLARLAGHGGAAAVLVLAVVLLNIDRHTASGPEAAGQPVLRSPGDAGRYLLHDAQARQRRDRIADELASAGVPVQRYERLGRFGLDAQITMPPAAAVAAVLALNGLMPAADGTLMVEVDAEAGAGR